MNKEGHCYKLSENLGDGYYWYYEWEGMFALAIMDLRLKEDTAIEYGCTITEFIQHKRMAQAEYMLLETDLHINQIAKAVGYHHAGRFSSLFHKSTGLLPEQYRRLIKKSAISANRLTMKSTI